MGIISNTPPRPHALTDMGSATALGESQRVTVVDPVPVGDTMPSQARGPARTRNGAYLRQGWFHNRDTLSKMHLHMQGCYQPLSTSTTNLEYKVTTV